MDADVVIAGGGPTGLMLACELQLCGVTPVVLERLPEISQIPKGNGLVGQIVPVLGYRGLLERLRAEATYAGPVPQFMFGQVDLDFAALDLSPVHILAIPQRRLEHVLSQRLTELGGGLRREEEITSLATDDDGVTLDLRGPGGQTRLRARYLVGCDGAHSLVRKQAGIGFPGFTSTEISRIGRVRVPDELIVAGTGEVDLPGFGRIGPAARASTPRGAYSVFPLTALDRNAEHGRYIVYTSEDHEGARDETPMTLDELRDSFRRVVGTDLPMSDPTWLTRTIGNSRLADRFRAGPVLLAGDAAHLMGLGGSLNVSLLDAVNLGWKLAAVVTGQATDALLDTYHSERHLAGERTIMQTRAQRALQRRDESAAALRELLSELMHYRDALEHVGELIEGSDARYPMPGAPSHPLAGRLVPDLRLSTEAGPVSVAALLPQARGLLLDGTADGAAARQAQGWSDRVQLVQGRLNDPPAPALLIRPDGCVAWAGAPGTDSGLDVALETWFGPPGPA
jgi:2-polyprenyl-6-methoxyphenol hydroxylase-like FAD-dependent oxidoreductase